MPADASHPSLGRLLVQRGVITDEQLETALRVQRDQGGFLGEILVEQGWLSASDLVLALATQLGLDLELRGSADTVSVDTLLPTDRPAARFEVLEDVGGTPRLLKTAETFMEATDFVFDEVLWQREPGSLEIVRVDAGEREVVWTFRPGDAAAKPADDLLGVFGYAVGTWEDKHGGESSLAAAG